MVMATTGGGKLNLETLPQSGFGTWCCLLYPIFFTIL
jgi:hypothetical protein